MHINRDRHDKLPSSKEWFMSINQRHQELLHVVLERPKSPDAINRE